MYYWDLFYDLTYNLPLKVFHVYLRRIGISLLGEYMIFFLLLVTYTVKPLLWYFNTVLFSYKFSFCCCISLYWCSFFLNLCLWILLYFLKLDYLCYFTHISHSPFGGFVFYTWYLGPLKTILCCPCFSFYMDKTFLFLCIFKNICWKWNMLEICCSNSES